ncbi:hypothetical protein H5410_021339 [Solanum commersonii]|uniref:Uncharacterized protein n=1 Tax=Solanum commersonii TaxID=4109 RepID=A0A9J5ZBP0_SOLCO|nr:hypothetical protein H5410_021339 [Solanum commersonii]
MDIRYDLSNGASWSLGVNRHILKLKRAQNPWIFCNPKHQTFFAKIFHGRLLRPYNRTSWSQGDSFHHNFSSTFIKTSAVEPFCLEGQIDFRNGESWSREANR